MHGTEPGALSRLQWKSWRKHGLLIALVERHGPLGAETIVEGGC